MSFTMIHDSITTSLELELSGTTANKIASIRFDDNDARLLGVRDNTKWEFIHGEKGKRSQIYYCHLRHAVTPGKSFDKKKDHWYTSIFFVVENKNNSNVLRIKANPTAISLQRCATAKAGEPNNVLFPNALDYLEHIYKECKGKPLWNEAERKRIQNLDLNIADVEVAIPFECKSSKREVLRVLNSIYDTSHTLSDKKFSIAKELNLRVETYANGSKSFNAFDDIDIANPDRLPGEKDTKWMKDEDFVASEYKGDDNIRFSVFRGTNQQFSITFYDKASEMKFRGAKMDSRDADIWNKSLRMDIRMTRSFLENYTGSKPKIRDWVKWTNSEDFGKILEYILVNRLRLYDLTISADTLHEMSERIKDEMPEFHKLWLNSMAMKSSVSAEYKAYSRICKSYNIKPTTGGKLLHMAVRTGLLENVSEKEFLFEDTFVNKLKFKKSSPTNSVSGLNKTKLDMEHSIANMCGM